MAAFNNALVHQCSCISAFVNQIGQIARRDQARCRRLEALSVGRNASRKEKSFPWGETLSVQIKPPVSSPFRRKNST